jgi:hypothetical protein
VASSCRVRCSRRRVPPPSTMRVLSLKGATLG